MLWWKIPSWTLGGGGWCVGIMLFQGFGFLYLEVLGCFFKAGIVPTSPKPFMPKFLKGSISRLRGDRRAFGPFKSSGGI